MKKEFIEVVKHYGIYDTGKYRYVYQDGEIRRIRKELLGTTAAYDGWETVYTEK